MSKPKRKIISFLGNGFYHECIYTAENGFKSNLTRFIQIALFEYLQSKEVKIDKFYLFVTEEAKKDNFYGKGKFDYTGLKKEWETNFESTGVKIEPIIISSKQSEKNQWILFEKIFEVIEKNDEIYFDITHSFRSIPVMSLLVANFARMFNDARIKRLFYGNFEALFEKNKPIVKIPENDRLAPIIDISNMLNLLDWSNGVESFIRTGDPKQIHELAIEENSGETSEEISDFTEKLTDLSKRLETNRTIDTNNKILEVKRSLEKISDKSYSSMPQFSKLTDEIEKKLDLFSNNRYENMWGSIKWCYDHGLYQQASTLAEEYILSYVFYEMAKISSHLNDLSGNKLRKYRGNIKGAIKHFTTNGSKEKKDHGDIKKDEFKILEEIVNQHSIAFLNFNEIVKIRNNMNHAEKARVNSYDHDKIVTKLGRLIKGIKPIFID